MRAELEIKIQKGSEGPRKVMWVLNIILVIALIVAIISVILSVLDIRSPYGDK